MKARALRPRPPGCRPRVLDDQPPVIFRKGERVMITVDRDTFPAHVELASGNGRSLVIAADSGFGICLFWEDGRFTCVLTRVEVAVSLAVMH
jgi:hypothetical protein